MKHILKSFFAILVLCIYGQVSNAQVILKKDKKEEQKQPVEKKEADDFLKIGVEEDEEDTEGIEEIEEEAAEDAQEVTEPDDDFLSIGVPEDGTDDSVESNEEDEIADEDEEGEKKTKEDFLKISIEEDEDEYEVPEGDRKTKIIEKPIDQQPEDIRKTIIVNLYRESMEQKDYPQAYLHIKYLERFDYGNAPETIFYKIKCLIHLADFNQPESALVKEAQSAIAALREMQIVNYPFPKTVDMEWVDKTQMNYFLEGPLYTGWLNDGYYKAAQEALQNGRYETALENFNIASSHNNGLAYYFLGVMHEQGMGIPKDIGAASAYFENAAEYQIGLAYLKLAQNILMDGDATIEVSELGDADLKSYLTYLKEAAMLNISEAKYLLGNYYLYYDKSPDTRTRNYKAYDWYVQAAQMSNLNAQIKLAEMHCKGQGTFVSGTEAQYWINLIAESKQVSQKVIVELKDCIIDLK